MFSPRKIKKALWIVLVFFLAHHTVYVFPEAFEEKCLQNEQKKRHEEYKNLFLKRRKSWTHVYRSELIIASKFAFFTLLAGACHGIANLNLSKPAEKGKNFSLQKSPPLSLDPLSQKKQQTEDVKREKDQMYLPIRGFEPARNNALTPQQQNNNHVDHFPRFAQASVQQPQEKHQAEGVLREENHRPLQMGALGQRVVSVYYEKYQEIYNQVLKQATAKPRPRWMGENVLAADAVKKRADELFHLWQDEEIKKVQEQTFEESLKSKGAPKNPVKMINEDNILLLNRGALIQKGVKDIPASVAYCQICCDNQTTFIILPCKHMLCFECEKKNPQNKCPFCRSPYDHGEIICPVDEDM